MNIFSNDKAPEHPAKLLRASEKLRSISSDEKSNDILDELFWEVDKLAYSEVEYYYKRRRRTGILSASLRFSMWSFGAFGVILPLLAAYQPEKDQLKLLTSLALAGAALSAAANSWFDGTSGHIRFTKTQLLLEHIIKKNRITWTSLRSSEGGQSDERNSIYEDAIKAYEQEVFKAIYDETENWENLLSNMKINEKFNTDHTGNNS